MSMGRQAGGGGIRFAAVASSVSGYGGRGVDGAAYRSQGGYLFTDSEGDAWWIVFQPSADASSSPGVRGDVLACSAGYGEVVHVRVLARDVLRTDADAVFQDQRPATYEEAAQAASTIARSER
jgi:hypothetical protein